MSNPFESAEKVSKPTEILQELMYLYGRDVWNLAYSLTRKADFADDISQDVFVKVYQKWNTIHNESSVKSWLLRITRNTAFDYRRSFYLKKVTLLGALLERGQHPSAEKEAYDKIIKDNAWKAVLKLPVKYREVLILYGHYDLSITEIAEILGVVESTVKTRLQRARKKAAELLKESDQNEGI